MVAYNFEKASNEEELYAQTLDIQIASHRLYESIYLAFDYGRISAVTVSTIESWLTIVKDTHIFNIRIRRVVFSSLK